MSAIFDVGYLAFAAVSAPWWLRKKRGAWAERFGRVTALPAPAPGRPRLLIHAVSLGETNLIRPLVERLWQDYDLVIASTTDTGAARARELYSTRARLTRYPLDASWAVRRFLDAVRPDGVALVELELWPTFARECRARRIPVAVINGRLSERSFRRYRLARPILGSAFAGLSFVAAQEEAYAARFSAVGAARDRVRVAGTMKWDAAGVDDDGSVARAAEALARDMGIDRSRPLIVAGSTAPDEHALLHAATPAGVQLLCAPRRPEWWDQAANDLPGCVRRSARSAAAPGGSDRFLLDSLGELRAAYALADVAVIGRSFGALHGSDPMDPAGLGKPVVIGPAHADFRATVEALEADGALLRTTRERLGENLRELFEDATRRANMGAAARECVRRHQGATARHAALLRSMLPIGSPA